MGAHVRRSPPPPTASSPNTTSRCHQRRRRRKHDTSSIEAAVKRSTIMPHSFSDATLLEGSIFLIFMLLWVAYGIINQYNSIEGIIFDPTTVVWSQEVLKITLSLILFFVQDGDPRLLIKQVKEHWTMLIWYSIPAGLYALADVLTYINLRSFDPATLLLLGEMKLVLTAIVHQFLFRRILNKWHWTALSIITAGCILKALDSIALSSAITSTEDANADNTGNSNETSTASHNMPQPTLFNYGLIAVSMIITTIAGVSNEKLLKDKPAICINLQNMCLYLDGIIFLSIGMVAGISDEHKSITEALSPTSLKALFSQPSILAMAVIMSLAGLVTSRFLKIFDSIRKSVATALTVVSLPILSRFFFHTPITVTMVVSILMVVLGMHLYTSQPPPARVDSDGVVEDDDAELISLAIAFPGQPEVGNPNINSQYKSVSQEMPELLSSTLSNSVV